MPKRKPIPNLVKFPDERCGPVWQDSQGNRYEAVREAYLALLHACFPEVEKWSYDPPKGQRVPCMPDIKHFYPTGMMATYHQMTPVQQKAANLLYIEIGNAIRRAYKEGLDHGRDLLMGLAKGEISTTDFNDGVVVTDKDES
jgi:hypothetical protein